MSTNKQLTVLQNSYKCAKHRDFKKIMAIHDTLRFLGKHVIQTNPSKSDEKTEREREREGGGGGGFVENRNRRKIFGSRVCPI